MIKISFITPTSDYLHNPFRGDQHAQMHLLTILKERLGDDVETSLTDLRGIKKEFMGYKIPESDVYLQSIYTLDYNEQTSIVKILKESYPKAKHIAGGPHANLFPESCLETFDSVVLGDAEETISDVVKDIQKQDLKKVYNQKIPVDINEYPYADRSYLPKSAIARRGMMTIKKDKRFDELLGTTTLFVRGCPYKCSFCAIPQIRSINPKIRYRSPENIEREIEYLKRDYGIQGINLLDEIGLPLNRKMAISKLEAIARTGIKWRGQCRVDEITPEIASLMHDSGCIAMGLGVESASQEALNLINKKIDIRRSKETIRILKEHDIAPRVYMIMGLPGEPEDIADITWKFIEETGPDVVFLSLFTIRPGTEVYNNPKKFGIKYIDHDWSKNNHLFHAGEKPSLTFEYSDKSAWGKYRSKERILSDYEQLLSRIDLAGLSTLPS